MKKAKEGWQRFKLKPRETKKSGTQARSVSMSNTTSGIAMVRGMAIAFAITCIIFIAYGILLTYTNLSETQLPLVSLVCSALSAGVAGFDWASCMKKKGLIFGALAGFVYCVLLLLVNGIANHDFLLSLSKLMMLVVSITGGAIGGIIGVNGKR